MTNNKQLMMMTNRIIFKNPFDWENPTCDPIPVLVHVWQVDVDGRVVKIVSTNRTLARLKARLHYPKAKRIRVVGKVY